MKTKKQIKAREATKRQRKARKKHAYKSIFRDKAKFVKKKSVALSLPKQLSKQNISGCPPYYFELPTIDEARNGDGKDWHELYDNTIADNVDTAIPSDLGTPLALSVENVERFIDNELNKHEANP